MSRSRFRASIWIISFLAFVIPGTHSAATIPVNCNSGSLKTAVDTAAAGDTIVASGTCNENVLIRNERQRITIDGSGAGAGTRATVNGVNGNSPAFNVRGKGILIQNFAITGAVTALTSTAAPTLSFTII